jgi:formate hydrogenlyase subunit 3/multisubunit Na+/H+ antiporter MnhD subunit
MITFMVYFICLCINVWVCCFIYGTKSTCRNADKMGLFYFAFLFNVFLLILNFFVVAAKAVNWYINS